MQVLAAEDVVELIELIEYELEIKGPSWAQIM
jgi:hypothetical protein